MTHVDGKPPAWRFEAECLVWECAHAVPDDASEPEFWRAVADLASSRIDALPTVSGAEAASGFLRWLRENDLCGSMSSSELVSHYSDYSVEAPHADVHGNTMRRCLIALPGVRKMQEEAGRDGRRSRRFVWIVDAE